MHLQGRLRLTTLGDLLGTMMREGLSGTLELTEERGPTAGRVHALHLKNGLIVQVDTAASVAHIGEILVAEGWLDSSTLVELLQGPDAAAVPLGRRLVDVGVVPDDVLQRALRSQLRQRLEAVFQLQDARVAFRLVRPRRRELDVQRPLRPEEYLKGRPRARDRASAGAAFRAPELDPNEVVRRRDLELLGLDPSADQQTIRSAFRRLARTTHPDRFPRAQPDKVEVLRQRFADLSAAYHRLAG